MEENGLRSIEPEERVREEILGQIRSGALRPGDRLMTTNQIWERLPVSRRSVIRALRLLTDEGVLCVKIKAGYRVANPLPAFVYATEGTGALEPAKIMERNNDDTPSPGRMRELLAGTQGRASLTIYVSDLYPETIRCWERGLRSCGINARLLTLRDGGLDRAMLQRERPDLILATMSTLEELGEDNFLTAAELEKSLPGRRPLLPPVADLLRTYPELPGMPFSLTLEQMYLNTDLIQSLPNIDKAGDVWLILLKQLQESRKAGHCEYGLASSAVHPLFLSCGAMRREGNGVRYDRERTAAFLETIQPGDVLMDMQEPEKAFLEQKAGALIQCSFAGVYLRSNAKFGWCGYPLPLHRDGRVEGFPMLLSVAKGSPNQESCLQLLNHFLGQEFQTAYGAVSGVLPVDPKAACELKTLQALGLKSRMLLWMLEHCQLVRRPGFTHMQDSRGAWYKILDYFAGHAQMREVLSMLCPD